MTLEDRLEYCKLCKNRKFNTESGILCGLTNEKPQFEETCIDYNEDKYDREIHSQNLFYEKVGPQSLFETNVYPTSPRLISIAKNYLPNQFKIKALDIGEYVITPIILLSLFFIVANLELLLIYRFGAMSVIGILIFVVFRKNWGLMRNEITTIAVLNDQGIDIVDGHRIKWTDVEIAYVNVDLHKHFLILELLNKSDSIKLQINKTLGLRIILTIVEAYRSGRK